MLAVQLLRDLKTVPPNMSDDTCTAVDSDKLEPNMKETQNWATFDDNDKDDFWKRSEFEWDKDLDSNKKTNNDGFENENDFVASPLEERDLYSDKNVTEIILPELVVCDRENHVKDICVDDGVSSKEDSSVDGEICIGACECECTQEVGVESLSSEVTKHSSKNVCDSVIEYDNEVDHSISGEITDEVLSEKLVADDLNSLGKSKELKSLKALFDTRSSDASDVEHLSDQITPPKTSESPTVGSPDDDSNKGNSDLSYNSKTESGTITFDFNSIKLESESIDESLVKTNSLPIHDNTISNYLTNENKVQRGQGESSFSMASQVSGLISYSGSIPYSGSISIRSDSSTTSVRSFAFPILPNEWNSSPVRMAKADRRRFRWNKGWRNGLFCCRF